MESMAAYIPVDRRQAMARGEELPDRTAGAALFADVSGFTQLTEALLYEYGPRRGPEELTRQLNLVYDALVAEVRRQGGSILGFAGDAITCWFDDGPSTSSGQAPSTTSGQGPLRPSGQGPLRRSGQAGLRAIACGLAMQQAMGQFVTLETPSGGTVALALKVAVATGPVRRFQVGDPDIQLIDVLAGATLDRMAAAEHKATKGQVVVCPETLAQLGNIVEVADWREDLETGQRCAVVTGMVEQIVPSSWLDLSSQPLTEDQMRPWLLPPVYERLKADQGEFLAELRPAVALFLRFGGIDYDGDEAAGAKLDAYAQWVQAILARYDGYALQLIVGDKGSYLYAAFGAPIAHEDDAIRAVSAAQELRTSPAKLSFLGEVQIGVSQGQMRTGAYGGTVRRTYGVLGDDVNLAARLMQAAEPGQILVSRSVQEGTEGAFTWETLPELTVKGKREPVDAFRLTGVQERRAIRPQVSRYALPMVGREAELGLIEQKLDLALQGKGQVIGITGEAGIGKTRLIAEALRLAGERQVASYISECESYGTNTSYLVWRPIWRALFGIDPTWELVDQVRTLEQQLKAIDPSLVPRLPLLGAALNLTIPDNDLTRSFDAKLRKSSLEALLVDCLRTWARKAPLLLVLEDCHWLDPLSYDLVEIIGRAVADLPVVLVMAYRPPELERLQAPHLSRLAHFTEIGLTEFTPQEAETLIALKLGQFVGPQAEVPPALVERITTRAEGNPFYIEELLNYLKDRGIDPRDTEALEGLDLPTSLHSLIISRLDQRTDSQKITIRVASVIGRLFQAALLWGMYPELGPPERIKADLDALCRVDLTRADTPEPELAYLFKHIVTREVAYESLPYATRAMLHEQLAQYIELTYGEALDQYVNLLAYHYEHSENKAKTREYLRKAGEAAQADYANAAAIEYFQRLLPLLSAEEEVDIMLKLGDVLQLVGDWQEADETYQQALAIAEQSGDQATSAWCQTALGKLLWKQSQYAEALEWLDRAQGVFEELGDKSGVGQVLQDEGTIFAQQGELETARDFYEKSLAIRYEIGDKVHVGEVLNNLGIVARFRGDYEMAQALQEEGLKIRHELGDKWAIAMSLNNLGNVYLDQGDYLAARTQLEEAVSIQREIGDRYYLANALQSLGNVARDQGDYPASSPVYEESLTILWELGDRWLVAHLLEDMGGLAALQGQPERALRLVGAAAALRETIGAPLSPAYQEKLDKMLEPAREALGEGAAASTESEGKTVPLEQAIEYALGGDGTG